MTPLLKIMLLLGLVASVVRAAEKSGDQLPLEDRSTLNKAAKEEKKKAGSSGSGSSKGESLTTSNSFNLVSSPGNYDYNGHSSGTPYYANSYGYGVHPYFINPAYYHQPQQPHYQPSFGFYDNSYLYKSPSFPATYNPHYQQQQQYQQFPPTAPNNYYVYRSSPPPLPYYTGSTATATSVTGGVPSGNYQTLGQEPPHLQQQHPQQQLQPQQAVYNLPVLNARLNRVYQQV